MKKEIDELPYVLKVVFTPLIKSKVLTKALDKQGVSESFVKKILDKKYTSNFFAMDTTKQTEIRITTSLKNDFVEHITINMAQETEIKVVKEIFLLFKNFKEFSVVVIDEEIESMLNSEKMADEFIKLHSKVILDYDNFYANEFNVPKRDVLLKKTL